VDRCLLLEKLGEMKGLFSFGSKFKNKLSATRFEYTFTIHNLTPWPSGNRAIAIGWQRGKSKRGATRSVYPSTAPGRLGAVVRFNEKFDVSASLYKGNSGGTTTGGLGPFKKKCIILAVLETDGRTQATAALGRVVIDLSEFAAIEHQETRTFQVSCNKAIHQAVGDPQLTITIRSRWKKSSATATMNQDVIIDEAGSMSTDTTGSRMTANLSSFLRFKYGKGTNEEQDLQGFDASGNSTLSGLPGSSIINARSNMSGMGTIQEGPDEAGVESPQSNSNHRSTPRTTANSMPASPRSTAGTVTAGGGYSAHDEDAAREVDSSSTAAHSRSSSVAGPMNGVSPPQAAAPRGSLREMYAQNAAAAAAAAAPAVSTASSRTPPRPDEGGWHSRGPSVVEAGEDGRHPSVSQGRISRYSSSEAGALGGSEAGSTSTYAELLSVAATEVCVYLGRISAGLNKRPERGYHAPARRIARTMFCMGQQQGSAFGKQVLRIIETQVQSSPGDMASLVFWWSNLVHLRVMLALQAAGASGAAPSPGGSMQSARWASDLLGPELIRLERAPLFDSLLAQMWNSVLLPTVVPSGSSAAANNSAALKSQVGKATPVTKRAMQEAAIKRWFEGLDAVSAQLQRLGSRGHVDLLRMQVLQQCLRKVDALLFHYLVVGSPTGVDILSDYDPGSSLWGGPGDGLPALEESSLPFTPGTLTFGSGMSVKMTVTRLQQWASSAGVSEALGVGAVGGSLFPLLRAAADLLMMPKELLLEQSIRRDVSQSLSIRSMVHILEQFLPDEYAHDGVAPEIITALRAEGDVAPSMRPPLSNMSVTYRPPSNDAVLMKAEVPGVEYEGESEEEVEALGAMVAGPGLPAPSRIKMLHQLWALGVPRRRLQ